MDDLQVNLSDSINATARWFDQFFADESLDLDEEARAEARIRLGWEPRSRELNEFESRFRVRVSLPNMKHQTDLIFSDYDDREDSSSVKAARNEAIDNRNRFSVALRWRLKQSDDLDVSHRVGIGRKLQPYVKSEVRKTFSLTEINNIHVEASVYYYTQDRFGSHLMAQYEHQTSPDGLFRFDNHFYFRDEENDWIWQHGFHQYLQWNEKTAVIYGLFVEGNSRPNYRDEEYLVSIRWRRNALREWLFFEVEPFVLWSREEEFKPSYGVGLRVEGYFGQH
ncbi:hypothetical protein J0A66_00720 [Bowmanella dokdonensis]|uniref:Uncharacterized protein n=1 Tax=Bowmanella dokdonensis TaxID=751969 RepID=A0A939DJM3_9ALTE|nr:hypothetical protein [Bowmanella dokdonensis]